MKIFTLTLAALVLAGNASPVIIRLDDAAAGTPAIRALHGTNKGPISSGGLIDLTESMRELNIPHIRLHDCHWPNPDVVDMHAVFPNPAADPADPASYDFRLTDEYVAATRRTGARIVYRLGESIEHTTVKRHVHPPRDLERWVQVCIGIIRHYNEGWASGFEYGIEHWEIWNEPENRPVMWTGTDGDFIALYRTASRAVKARFPALKVGGPSFGHQGDWKDGKLTPSQFVRTFLDTCRTESLPLDFFSWHCYSDDPGELRARAIAVRALLDASGFPASESHLNEWNYLPGNSWRGAGKSSTPEQRRAFHDGMAGLAGAAFLAAALVELQRAPVDVCNFFHGETGGFGLFTEHGLKAKPFHAMWAFSQVQKLPETLCVSEGAAKDLRWVASSSKEPRLVRVLVVHTGADPYEAALDPGRFGSWKKREMLSLKPDGSMSPERLEQNESGQLLLRGTGPQVCLVELRE